MKFRRAMRYVCAIPVMAALILVACGSAATTTPQATATAPPPTQELTPLPLSEPGPYHIGKRQFQFEDASRDNRPVGISVWYPAVLPDDYAGDYPILNADPDLSNAPYPLILSSTKVAKILSPYLVTHGFVWASVDKIDTYTSWSNQLIRQPLDILFSLDQVASQPLEGLEDMIDTEYAGAIGYSFDGYNALALSGARIDPEFYFTQCANVDSLEPPLPLFMRRYYCNLSSEWDQFAAEAGQAITSGEDGLWEPMTDERIRAVIPMAPDGAWLFGERGLAAADRPTLIIAGNEDVGSDYHREAVYIFEHLGTPDKAMISFVGQDHMMVYEQEMVARMAHFAVAFFGYYLQDRVDYAEYFSEDFVAQFDDLAWGVYGGE